MQDAKKLVRGRGGIKIVHLDVKDHDKVRQLVQEANVVIRSVQLVRVNESLIVPQFAAGVSPPHNC